MTFNQILFIAYIAIVVIMSLVALAAYFKDKKLAIQGKDRIKEKTLLFFTVFYGAIGAFLGRILARHKTDKIYFSMVIYFSMLLQIGLAVYLAVLAIIVV